MTNNQWISSSIQRASIAIVLAASLSLGFAQSKKNKILPKRATAIALKRFPGKALGPAKLEHEDGRWQYEVVIRLGKKMKEVDVDAYTGKIVNVETSSEAEEAREAKHGG